MRRGERAGAELSGRAGRVSPTSRYAEPFWWWGPGWATPVPRGISELMRDETIDSWTAANLWAALARRRSVAVVAGPSGVGKTTLLTALLDFLPPRTRHVYPRGCFETFAFLSDPVLVAAETALLINEISPHLPVYLWGPAVGRMLEAADCGYTLLATAHADTVQEFVGMLTGSPLRLHASLVAAFEFVAVMERSADTRSGRRVRGVWRLQRTASGIDLDQLPSMAEIMSEEPTLSRSRPEPWFPVHELSRRYQALHDLRERRIEQLPVVFGPSSLGAIPSEP
jgi:energy-coupling factor transporter ATP-binding protein EcfA2